MKIKHLNSDIDEFTGNVFFLTNSENVLIDVGQGKVWNKIKDLEKIDKVVITHTHPDHIKNISKIKEKYNPEIFAYNPENLEVEAKKLRGSIKICNRNFEVIHTPGHKNDSVCLFNEGILFTGDLIFPDAGFGRTDLAEGDRDQLINSIKKLRDFEVEEIYPGHGEPVKNKAKENIENSLKEAKKKEPKY